MHDPGVEVVPPRAVHDGTQNQARQKKEVGYGKWLGEGGPGVQPAGMTKRSIEFVAGVQADHGHDADALGNIDPVEAVRSWSVAVRDGDPARSALLEVLPGPDGSRQAANQACISRTRR